MVDASSYPNAGTLHRERMRFERDFTQLPNAWLRDKRLSFRARGLLAHLMTHDVGYSISLNGLVAATSSEARDAIRTAVHELEAAGYLHRVKERRKGKFGGYRWVLQDPFEAVTTHVAPTLWPVDNPPHRVGSTDDGSSNNGGSTASVDPTTIEDQVKNNSRTSGTTEPLDSPVDNRGTVVWSDDRCPGNWRDGRHELGEHGMCRHCHVRPAVRSAS